MEINMELLATKLRENVTLRYNRLRWDQRTLEAPLVLEMDERPEEQYVYVCLGSRLRAEQIHNASLICAGAPSIEVPEDECSMLICDTEDVVGLYNMVQKIFLRLHRWENRLRDASRKDVDMQTMLNIAAEELPFSMLYVNKHFTLLSSVLSPEQAEENPQTLTDTLLSVPELNGNSIMEKPLYFCLQEQGLQGYALNFHYNSDYRGKLILVCPLSSKLEDIYLLPLRELSEGIRMLYRLFSVSSVRTVGYRYMQRTLKAMLEPHDEPEDMTKIREDGNTALQSALWNINDYYVLYFIPFVGSDSLVNRAEYLVTRLENCWNVAAQGSSRGVVLSNGICWIVNLSRPTEITYGDFLPELGELLKEYGAVVGVSSLCRDFYSLHRYKVQAALAARIGMTREPDERIYMFNHYSLDYMISGTTATFTPDDVIHPCLHTLIRYDRENGTEFCKTLRLYMQYQYNVLQASSLLFIHRSTFSVRIKRIETLCKINLEDERTRLHILLSFYILDTNGIHYMD